MSHRTSVLLPLLLAACTSRPLGSGESATETGTTGDDTTTGATTLPGTSATTLPGTSATTLPGTGSDTEGTGPADPTTTSPPDPSATGGGCPFLCPPDTPGNGIDCDTWVQDCPIGQKCMPYSGDGDNSWESLKCVDIVRDPAGLYEPCTLGPISTGEDTCDKGLMCWNTDPDTGMGTCHGMCTGSPDNPGCADPDADCHLSGDGVLTLCLPMCDPLVQDCAFDDLCIPNPQDPNRFLCVIDASGEEGQTFDPCEYANACDKGHACLAPELAAECDPMIIGCCIPFCDITLPNTCPGAGQECLPWHEQGQAPPSLANVGICALPMP